MLVGEVDGNWERDRVAYSHRRWGRCSLLGWHLGFGYSVVGRARLVGRLR